MLVGGFNPFENMSQIGFIFPNDRGENSKNIEKLPPPSHGCSPTGTCEVTTPCQPYGFLKDFVEPLGFAPLRGQEPCLSGAGERVIPKTW